MSAARAERSSMAPLEKVGTILAAVLALLLVGCGDDVSDLEAYMQEVKSRKFGPIEPLPEVQPYESYAYHPEGLRDPFAPAVFAAPQAPTTAFSGPANQIRPDVNRRRELLEEFPLDTLRMVGTLERDGQIWGLVKAPDGTIHRVRPGNHIGQNYGEITRVSEEGVEVNEIIADGLGGWLERQASLALSK